jgi:hypothetical protein
MNDSDRRFDPGELCEMAGPMLDRVMEAIDAGGSERALELCREMEHEHHRDPCRWYWYKDPARIPGRFAARYGLADRDEDG